MRSHLLAVAAAIGLSCGASAVAGADWTKRATGLPRPNGIPPSHDWSPLFVTLVYDSHRRVTVGLGGHTNPNLVHLAVSEYDGANWISRYDPSATNAPSHRSVGNAVFDSRRNVTVVFGGWIGNSENALDELWEYNGTTWTQRTWTGLGPAKSVNVPMCFDPWRGRTICLTLSPADGTWETWEWTGAAWERGPDLTGVNDGAGTSMVFDIARNRAFVYTRPYGGSFEATYEYIPGSTAADGTWQHVPISGAPFEAKIGASLVYDPYRRRVLRHGGRFVSGIYSYIDGTYEWDAAASRWQLFAFLPEEGRGGAGICYDTHRLLTVMYGGIRVWVENGTTVRTTNYTDTWEFVDNRVGETWVEYGYNGEELGTPQQPWNTLAEALTHAPSNGIIYLKGGFTSEPLRSSDWRSATVHLRGWNSALPLGP